MELLIWDSQPVAAKLADVAHCIHRLPRPTGIPIDDTTDQEPPDDEAAIIPAVRPERHDGLAARLLTAVVTGVAVAAGQRLFDALARHDR